MEKGIIMKINEYYKGKRILITGTTGFLGKVVLEKLLWEAPDVEKVILLMRPARGEGHTREGALSRFEKDILSSRIFDRLRKRQKDFQSFISKKIHAFPCDLFQEDLGLSDTDRQTIFTGLDAIIHVAAQVSWDERLDYSIKVNALASKRLLEYGKAVTPNPRFVYISSAYVNGKRTGKVAERPFDPNQSIANELGEKIPFAIESEINATFAYAKKVEMETLSDGMKQKFRKEAELQLSFRDDIGHSMEELAEILRKKYVHSRLSDYGIQQANLHGWTDSYCLSKAMGEMLLVKYQENVPLAIIRPPGITSAVKDPSPGWLEGFHLVEPLIVGMGKGLIKAFPGSEKSLIDTVPVDYVVSLILAACATLTDADKPYVYQIGTSHTNPITLSEISKIWRSYFQNHPMTTDHGKPIGVKPIKFFKSPESFNQKIQWQYLYPLTIAEKTLMRLQFAKGSKWYRNMIGWVIKSRKKAERVCRFSDLYSAYTMNSWVFMTDNSIALFQKLSLSDQVTFDFDTSKLDWKKFWNEVHIPGMKKYVLK
jgi:alcohol-forming fatty acyl-CoA reductase